MEIHKSGKLGTSTIPKIRLYHISAQALELGREVGTVRVPITEDLGRSSP